MVVDVERVGVCGTDVEFFTGEMAYLHRGHSSYPMRLGHEWTGMVSAVGDGVGSSWLGRRVTGDTMIGDGTCRHCRRGHQHVCDNRQELGVRDGRPGALAEQLAVPASSLHLLPDSADLRPGDRALVLKDVTAVGVLSASPGWRPPSAPTPTAPSTHAPSSPRPSASSPSDAGWSRPLSLLGVQAAFRHG